MWKDPIYRFRIPHEVNLEGDELLKEIVLDVTLSAPNSDTPGKLLERDVFTSLLNYLNNPKDLLILDFGAGKLRNTVYLLDKGHSVCAVEFEKLRNESEQLQKKLLEAEKFGNRFRQLKYPSAFIESKDGPYDLVILINVMSTMPVPCECLFVLQQCYKKLKPNGYLLWLTSYAQTTYKQRFTEDIKLGDGYYTGENRFLKAFFREFREDEEIDEIMESQGFIVAKSFPVNHSKARLYQKHPPNMFSNLLTVKRITEEIVVDMNIEDPKDVKPKIVKRGPGIEERVPNPESLSLESLYIEVLNKLPVGREDASRYHRLVTLILRRIFRPNLVGFEIEGDIHEGRKRIDIVARNESGSGFWKRLTEKHGILCPYIMIECKNYEGDPKNPEFDQLVGRFSAKRGMCGLLVYRRSIDRNKLMRTCRDFVNDNKGYVLLFEDTDLIDLLILRQKGLSDEIDNYLEQKWRELFFERKKR